MFYIEHNNNKLPLIIDYSVIKKLATSQDIKALKNIDQLDLDSFEQIEKVLFLALERGHKLEQKEFNLKSEDIEDILSVSQGDFFSILSECMVTAFQPTKKKIVPQDQNQNQ